MKILQRLQNDWMRYNFKRPQQLAFLGVFYRLMAEGLGPREVLEKMEMAQDPQWGFAAEEIRLRLATGMSISKSFESTCDRDICEVLRAPEQSNDYANRAKEAIAALKAESKNQGAWLSAILQPGAYVVLLFLIYAVLADQFFPSFPDSVDMPKNGAPYIVKTIGEFLLFAWPVVIAVLIFGVWGIRYSLPRWAGAYRMKFDRFVPLSLYREMVAAKIQRQLSMLMAAGHDLKTALRVLEQGSSNHTASYLNKMRNRIPEGLDHGAILDVGLLNDWDINELRLLAGCQGFLGALQSMAEEAQSRAEKRLQMAAKTIASFLYLLVSLMMVGFLSAITAPASQLLSSSLSH